MLTLHDLNKLSKEIQQNPDYLTELLKMNKNLTNFTLKKEITMNLTNLSFIKKNDLILHTLNKNLISSCGIDNVTTLKVYRLFFFYFFICIIITKYKG
jgi:hypothetical protein